MRIQHNIAAMNSFRNYTNNASSLSKNLEKLSSGYRINRAGDDAAGLAISEKMRAQIAGLDQAQNNVKDGISLVKTAEGALQEVQDMMNRMVTLATQSANGTYQDDVDREALQDEVDALLEEIDRIADSSNFNGQKLLNGDIGGRTATIADAAANSMLSASIRGGGTGTVTGLQATLETTGKVIIKHGNAVDGITWEAVGEDTVDPAKGGTVTYKAVVTKNNAKADMAELYEGMTVTVRVDKAANGTAYTAAQNKTLTVGESKGLTLQIGDAADDFNQLEVAIDDMRVKALAIDDVDISSIEGAQEAIDKVKTAINTVSSQRGRLGAIQNRLEHTQNNLSVMTENIQDAESAIRDVDIADEMTAYTKNNILLQSAQAMLAQANQMPQGVLQLLQ